MKLFAALRVIQYFLVPRQISTGHRSTMSAASQYNFLFPVIWPQCPAP